jgi:hypothetical protein
VKAISYDEWSSQFLAVDDDAASDIKDNPEGYAFYDNGAVKNIDTQDFVVKFDRIKRKN